METLRYGAGDPAVGIPDDEGEAELLSLAVDAAHRRTGTGTALVEAFLRTVSASGVPSARVVVGATNENAIRLYRNAGFEPADSMELHRGTPSLVLRVKLPGRVAL